MDEKMTAWKMTVRTYIADLYSLVPPAFPRYKLQKEDFLTGATGDDEYLRNETTRLFTWLALTKLRPNAPVKELRQMTTYRPDTYHLLHHFATVVTFLYHYEPTLLNNARLGIAPIERLLITFLHQPERFSASGRRLLPRPDKPQMPNETAVPVSPQNQILPSVAPVAPAASLPHAAIGGQDVQITSHASFQSLDLVDEFAGRIGEKERHRREISPQADRDIIQSATCLDLACHDQNCIDDTAETRQQFD
jgi:hypothetical protein